MSRVRDRFSRSKSSTKKGRTGLRALQESADKNRALYAYSEPNPKLLETFDCPTGPKGAPGTTVSNLVVRISTNEFTSLCPLTGQPDFATIKIAYRPRRKCVESKSLKLYLLGYRMFGEFHEQCVQRILNDLVMVLDPLEMRVVGEFTPRGGIPFWPEALYRCPRWSTEYTPIPWVTKELRGGV